MKIRSVFQKNGYRSHLIVVDVVCGMEIQELRDGNIKRIEGLVEEGIREFAESTGCSIGPATEVTPMIVSTFKRQGVILIPGLDLSVAFGVTGLPERDRETYLDEYRQLVNKVLSKLSNNLDPWIATLSWL